MKKILIINGSPRIGQTKRLIGIFRAKLGKEFAVEIVNLRKTKLFMCRGCAMCLQKGEEFCPSKDALPDILRKMDEADAIVFASPNYALGLPGLFKNFFDRLAFVYHRPRFFNKVFASVVTQGVYGGKDIKNYFKRTAGFWGGHYLSGSVVTLASAAYNPGAEWTSKEAQEVEKKLSALASKMNSELRKNDDVYQPDLFRLSMFRLARTSHKSREMNDRDYMYFKEHGWFDSDYFYEAGLSPLRKLAGKLIDTLAKRMADKG